MASSRVPVDATSRARAATRRYASPRSRASRPCPRSGWRTACDTPSRSSRRGVLQRTRPPRPGGTVRATGQSRVEGHQGAVPTRAAWFRLSPPPWRPGHCTPETCYCGDVGASARCLRRRGEGRPDSMPVQFPGLFTTVEPLLATRCSAHHGANAAYRSISPVMYSWARRDSNPGPLLCESSALTS